MTGTDPSAAVQYVRTTQTTRPKTKKGITPNRNQSMKHPMKSEGKMNKKTNINEIKNKGGNCTPVTALGDTLWDSLKDDTEDVPSGARIW